MFVHIVPIQQIPAGIRIDIDGPLMSSENADMLSQFIQENDFVLELTINPIVGNNAPPQEPLAP
jgi:hypothetical protein